MCLFLLTSEEAMLVRVTLEDGRVYEASYDPATTRLRRVRFDAASRVSQAPVRTMLNLFLHSPYGMQHKTLLARAATPTVYLTDEQLSQTLAQVGDCEQLQLRAMPVMALESPPKKKKKEEEAEEEEDDNEEEEEPRRATKVAKVRWMAVRGGALSCPHWRQIEEPPTWVCICTYINDMKASLCTVCGSAQRNSLDAEPPVEPWACHVCTYEVRASREEAFCFVDSSGWRTSS